MFLENAEKAVDVSHRSLRNIAISTNSILPRVSGNLNYPIKFIIVITKFLISVASKA